jgi:hypothetical protein
MQHSDSKPAARQLQALVGGMPHLHSVKLLVGALPAQRALQLMPAADKPAAAAVAGLRGAWQKAAGQPAQTAWPAHYAGRWQKPWVGPRHAPVLLQLRVYRLHLGFHVFRAFFQVLNQVYEQGACRQRHCQAGAAERTLSAYQKTLLGGSEQQVHAQQTQQAQKAAARGLPCAP